MNNYRNKLAGNFTTIQNEIINDARMSWKGKGILLYLASKPDNWSFYMEEINSHATDGLTALKSGVKELEELGYLVRSRRKNNEGKYDGWIWTLTDSKETHQSGNLPVGKSISRETLPYSNTDNSNTNNSNTDNSSVTTKLSTSPQAKQLSEYFLECICESQPTHRYCKNKPSIEGWAVDIDRMLKLDGRDFEGVKAYITYIFYSADDTAKFWRANVQSGKKLRDKFDTIKAQMERERSKGGSGKRFDPMVMAESIQKADQYLQTTDNFLFQD